MNKSKGMFIPLINDKYIMLMFHENNGDWVCRISDEGLNDIHNFFETEVYVLDGDKKIIINEASDE